jgi:PleD family two-component response regulator
MGGNFGAIVGFNLKLKAILNKELGAQDTKEARIALADRESQKLNATLIIPQQIAANVYEGFEPLTVSKEIIEKHYLRIFNFILDFDSSKSDTEFIEGISDVLSYFIGEWIEELQDGFENGM